MSSIQPSTYQGTITFTYQELLELSFAISARISDWFKSDKIDAKAAQYKWLSDAYDKIEEHIVQAVNDYEKTLTKEQLEQLNKEFEEEWNNGEFDPNDYL